jgi:hypothetical protein
VERPELLRAELRSSVELGEDYPEDAPIYPGATTSHSGRRAGKVTAAFSTEDSMEMVSAYVSAKLKTEGWSDSTIEEMPSGAVIHAQKGTRQISVLVSSMDEGTEYELTMMIVAVDAMP